MQILWAATLIPACGVVVRGELLRASRPRLAPW